MGRRIDRPQPLAQRVGVNLREIRTRRGLSMARLEALTDLCGFRVPCRSIGEMEAGRNAKGMPRSVTVDELAVLARVLRVPALQLLVEPRCRRCWDVPLPEFTCQRCGTSGQSTSTRKP